jgi:DNA-binding response OmpR family regulator
VTKVLYFIPPDFKAAPRKTVQTEIEHRLRLNDISFSYENSIKSINAEKDYDIHDWDDLRFILKHNEESQDVLVVVLDGEDLRDDKWFLRNKLKLLADISPQLPIVAYLYNSNKDSAFTLHAAGFPFIVRQSDDERTLAASIPSAFCQKRGVDHQVTVGPLTIDLFSHDLYFEGRLINTNPTLSFSKTERSILAYLASNLNRCRSQEQILSAVWGGEDLSIETNPVSVYISRLRANLDWLDPIRYPDLGNRIIQTVWGIGVCMKKWDESADISKTTSPAEAFSYLSQQMAKRPSIPANDTDGEEKKNDTDRKEKKVKATEKIRRPERPGYCLLLDKNESCLRISGAAPEVCVISLTQPELTLLSHLMENPGTPLSSLDWRPEYQKLIGAPTIVRQEFVRTFFENFRLKLFRQKPNAVGSFVKISHGCISFIPPRKASFSISTPKAPALSPRLG